MSLANLLNASSGTLQQGCWKRKGSDEEGKNPDMEVKKAKYSYQYFILARESPPGTSSEEDNESIHSIQAQETEYVQDTSDTDLSSTSMSEASVEFEPESFSEDENPMINLSSSEAEDISRVAEFVSVFCDTDVGLADDSDVSSSSRDSEISRTDYWTCVQCNTENNNPKLRLCQKCYEIRRNFLPPRPKGKRQRRKELKEKSTEVDDPKDHELIPMDSGIGSQQLSQSSEISNAKSVKIEISSLASGSPQVFMDLPSSQDSNVDIFNSQPSTSSQSLPGTSQQSELMTSFPTTSVDETDSNELHPASQESVLSGTGTLSVDSKDSDVETVEKINVTSKIFQAKKNQPRNDSSDNCCMICTVNPRDGIFVHGRITHICCCYQCAKIVWKTKKYCPICNRRVRDVLKAYYA